MDMKGSIESKALALLSDPEKDEEEKKASSIKIQAKFRAFQTRQGMKLKIKYLSIRQKLVFSQYARQNADAKQRDNLLGRLRSFVPEVIFSKLVQSAESDPQTSLINGRWNNLLNMKPGTLVQSDNLNRFDSYGFTETCCGAMIFVDLDGFVSLTEKILEWIHSPLQVGNMDEPTPSHNGQSGTATASELLMECINAHLEQMIEVIDSFGGDVLKFAGDAVQVYFPCGKSGMLGSGYVEATSRAIRCSLNIMKRLQVAEIMGMNRNMTVKIGVSVGDMELHVVGGMCARYECFMSGLPVTESSAFTGAATSGNELIISKSGLELCGINFSKMLPKGLSKVKAQTLPVKKLNGLLGERIDELYVMNDEFNENLLPALSTVQTNDMETSASDSFDMPPDRADTTHSTSDPLADPNTPNKQTRNHLLPRLKHPQRTLNTSAQLVGGISSFITMCTLPQILKGHIKFMSGIRNLTVSFMQFVEYEELLNDKGKLQQMFIIIQSTLYTYLGSVRQIMIDDKGMVIIGFFGMKGYQHPVKALRAALYLNLRFKELGIRFANGLTSGQCYFGLIGSQNRAEVTIAGSTVNKAARLMGAAKNTIVAVRDPAEQHEGSHQTAVLFCDKEVKDACGEYSALCEFRKTVAKLKGFKGLSNVYHCVPTKRSNAHKKMLIVAKDSIVWSRSHTNRTLSSRRASTGSVGGRKSSTEHGEPNPYLEVASPGRRSSIVATPTIDSEYLLGPGGDTLLLDRGIATVGSGSVTGTRAKAHARVSVVDMEQFWGAMFVVAVGSRYSDVLAFNCLYECITERSIRYRLKTLLNEMILDGTLEVLETGVSEVTSYRVLDHEKLRKVHDGLLKSDRDDIHLMFANVLQKYLREIETDEGSKPTLAAYVGPSGTTTTLLVSIANHLSASAVQYRDEAAKFLATASKRCFEDGDIEQANDCARGALLLLEEDERNKRVERGILEHFTVRHDWNKLKSAVKSAEKLVWSKVVYQGAMSMLHNFGVNIFSQPDLLGSHRALTFRTDQAGSIRDVEQSHALPDDETLVLIVNYSTSKNKDYECAYSRQGKSIKRLYRIRNMYPNLFFYVNSPINHEWVDLTRASVGPRNFQNTKCGVRLQFESNSAALACMYALETLAKLCTEYDFKVYPTGAKNYLDYHSGMDTSPPALLGQKNKGSSSSQQWPAPTLSFQQKGGAASMPDSPRTRGRKVQAAFVRSISKADVVNAFRGSVSQSARSFRNLKNGASSRILQKSPTLRTTLYEVEEKAKLSSKTNSKNDNNQEQTELKQISLDAKLAAEKTKPNKADNIEGKVDHQSHSNEQGREQQAEPSMSRACILQ